MAARPVRLHDPYPAIAIYLIAAALIVTGGVLTVRGFCRILPPDLWWAALNGTAGDDVQALIFANVTLPRIAISLLVGTGLGFSGALFQQVLRNPLADTTTLGVSAGAYLALAIASLYVPALLAFGHEIVALCGGSLAAAIVILLSWRVGFSTVSLILCGLTTSLLCGAIGAVLTLFNHEYLNSLFVWQTGSLVQNGWDNALRLAPCLVIIPATIVLLVRPLGVLELDDSHARSLGLPVGIVRASVMAIAVVISSLTVSAVGVIGFVGLAAPHVARFIGARTIRQRLIVSPVVGAVLLWVTDQIVQNAPLFRVELPTGSAAALLGAPVLLWLITRTRANERPSLTMAGQSTAVPQARPMLTLLGAAAVFILAIFLALKLGANAQGWGWANSEALWEVMPWRGPRVLASAAAGSMLAVAGLMMQRVTGNVMASPEVLGITSGAAIGVILLLMIVPGFSKAEMFLAASAGALLTLILLVLFNQASGLAPDRLLLTGIALTTLFSACAAVMLTSGDPRAAVLLTWMSGSTYRVTQSDALAASITAFLAILAAPLTARWIAILPLGNQLSQSLGVKISVARFLVLLLSAVLTAGATLIVGPLSYVGLIAPHVVRLLGMRRPIIQIFGAAFVGGALLTIADWIGRNVMFPWQIPAGLVATIVGAPIFFWLLGRRGA